MKLFKNAGSLILLLSLSLGTLAMGIGGIVVGCSGTAMHKTTKAQHTLKEAVAAFQAVEIAEYNKGFVPPERHLKIQVTVQKVALAGVDLDNYIAANANAATVKAKFDAIYALLDSLNTDGILGIKNANTKQLLETALDAIKALVDNYLIGVNQ